MRTATRILVLGFFVVLTMIAGAVQAQTIVPPTNRTAQNHAVAEKNGACQKILGECKRLGFIQGQWEKDNGLWRDCFDPVVKGGGTPTRDGKPINVPVSPAVVQACRAAESRHR
jgi:hypothetical protein